MSIGGRRCAGGVTVHAGPSLTVALHRRCTACEARAGVDDLALGLAASPSPSTPTGSGSGGPPGRRR
ncbi:NPCBM/NEW2 domain-containing protein [Streptomyces sp. NPDC006193]|uniref:NPCBM/NEW2 domain-containing protein n=1 Tax=Streptomyces sp. NPDC006193 TaxID=3155717 RepID=UPI0033A01263